jgi:hypothetical protein
MSDTFDPYIQWLGIRDPQRPPNHYRLLGVDLFEGDADVLTNAADRQMAHVRNFQTGKRSALSQKLLNELASAKICLLNAQKKADYDARIRADLAAAMPAEATAALPTTAAPGGVGAWMSPQHERPPVPAPFPAAEEPPLVDLGAGYRATAGAGTTSWVSLAIAVLSALAVVLVGLIVFVSQRGAVRDQASPVPVTVVKPAEPGPNLSAEIEEPQVKKRKPPAAPSSLQAIQASPASMSTAPSPPLAGAVPTASKPGGPGSTPQAVSPAAAGPSSPPTPAASAPAASQPGAPGSTLPTAASPAEAKANPAAVKEPAPKGTALEKARGDIRKIFAKEFAAAERPEQKSKLAGMLLKQALETKVETKDDATARYGLFCEAREQATSAVDLDLYAEIVEKTAAQYDIDPLAIKAEDLRRAVKRPRYSKPLVKALLAVAEEMIAADRYDEANALVETARVVALPNRDTPHAKEAAALRRDIEQMRKLRDASEEAEKTLAADDPAANTLRGKYFCFGKNNWERGLSLLAKGNNEWLKKLADAEAITPASAAQMAALGDQWWDAAASGEIADVQRYAQARAAFWYRRALPELSGLTKAKIERRLAEAGR